MTTFPNSPRLVEGGIVLIDPQSAPVLSVIALQYNPDMLSRTLQVQAGSVTAGGGIAE
jgi:Fe-S cluster assembly iron-binding protein IscA